MSQDHDTFGAGLALSMTSGPLQNNGSTTWYAEVPFGTPGQSMKIAFDTGSNFLWVSSTLCQENGNACTHYGGGFFNYNKSSTYAWMDRTRQSVGFGPWGTMTVETGQDLLNIGGNANATVFYLSEEYSGVQYEQLDWDGGLGIPSGTAYVKEGMSNPINDLYNCGALNPGMPYLSFDCDEATKRGTLLLGGFDTSRYKPSEYIYMPWVSYLPYPKVNYMWNCAIASIAVGGKVVATNKYFCLDSGSSRFKGDPAILNPILKLVQASGYTAPLELTFAGGTLVVPASVYMKLIEAGPDKGQVLPQFEPMDGLDDQLLVGSVLMDQLYTIFNYAIDGQPGNYTMTPSSMWVFNKVGGPTIVSETNTEGVEFAGQGPAS